MRFLLPTLLQQSAPPAAVVSPLAPLALLADTDVAASSGGVGGLFESLQAFQDSHAFLIGVLSTILIRYIISEARYRIEKPVMDEFGNKVAQAAKENLTPDTERIENLDWAKLVLCIAMDLAGDASELIPFLGEFTDIAYAPVEAAALKGLFNSNLIAGFGFAEEILPFTDVIPTFTISWMLANIWGTTKLAKKLGVAK